MTLGLDRAKTIIAETCGAPIKDVQYLAGYRAGTGRILAISNRAAAIRIWCLPPNPPSQNGLRLIGHAKDDNLNGPLAPLNESSASRVEVDTEDALRRFLAFYVGANSFSGGYELFKRLILDYSGHPFTGFGEGMAAAWENYKPRLRDFALSQLKADTWRADEIGEGRILQSVIDAIEIQNAQKNLTNNLVFWQNRYGHAARDHKVLLEAQQDRKNRRELEGLFFSLYRSEEDEGALFERIAEDTGSKYPLIAYFFFLRDSSRFAPIAPTNFDLAFAELGIGLSMLQHCSWENYSRFNQELAKLRGRLEAAGNGKVTLIDAHSFCWILATLIKEKRKKGDKLASHADAGRIGSAREKCILDMKYNILQTVQNSRGQIVERTQQMKLKLLNMSEYELEAHLRELAKLQNDRCALTGIPFVFDGDLDLRPSPDRKDSNGHYERGNIQLVCRFINFWKSDRTDDNFLRLIGLVRNASGDEDSDLKVLA
jgi:hypothetical protein